MSAPTIITTGHDINGLSTFIDGPAFKAVSQAVGLIYSTDGKPLNLNNDADIAAFRDREHAGVIPKEGAVVLAVEWPPSTDSRDRIHRTLSVDIGVMVQGSIECHLDSKQSRTIKQGEILIQRGTNHAWVNSSPTETAKMICVVFPSQPVAGAQ